MYISTMLLLSIYSILTVPGVTYVRWGNTSCPDVDGTSRVYEGRAASGYFSNTGGASDFVCLISEGEYHPTATTNNPGWAYMYGTKYQIAITQTNLFNRWHHNVPCAVCDVDDRSRHLMIPGTYKCPSGWTTEYFGWLMTGHNNNPGRSTFVCVDFNAEFIPDEAKDDIGAHLYHVQAYCPSDIECPPYDQKKEVSCVVCTK